MAIAPAPIAFECQQVLAGLGLPAAGAFAHDDAVADRADRKPGQRHRVGQVPAQFAHRARDALAPAPCASASACAVRSTIRSWNEKRHALRGPRAGDDEAGVDQRADRAARQAQQLLDVAHAVRVHHLRGLPTAWPPCAVRVRRFLGALRALRRACGLRQAPWLRPPSTAPAPAWPGSRAALPSGR